jgi:hypothetical protein
VTGGVGDGERILRERVAGAAGQPHITIANAGRFVQEDRGPELAAVTNTFITSTRRPASPTADSERFSRNELIEPHSRSRSDVSSWPRPTSVSPRGSTSGAIASGWRERRGDHP